MEFNRFWRAVVSVIYGLNVKVNSLITSAEEERAGFSTIDYSSFDVSARRSSSFSWFLGEAALFYSCASRALHITIL